MEELDLIKQEIAELKRKVDDLLTLSYRQQLRLKNALSGNKTYWVASGNGGTNSREVTFKDGILTLEASASASPSISPSASPSVSPSASPSASPS